MNLNFKKNGFVIKKIKDKNILKKLKSIVKKHFYRSSDYYQKLSRSDFSKIALKCQKEIDKLNIMKKFHKSEKSFFKRLVDNDEILYYHIGFSRNVSKINKLLYVDKQWAMGKQHFQNTLVVLKHECETIELSKHLGKAIYKTSINEIKDTLLTEFIKLASHE